MTRYPEPGFTKTRLIPALGAERAARLHACLIRTTLTTAKQAADENEWQVSVLFAGGDVAHRKLLCADLPTAEIGSQVGDSLGNRISRAMASAFTAGAARVVVIGTDSPDLQPLHLRRAFSCLKKADLVLGPAVDGGYYLIGLRSDRPELFRNIDWGTEHVLQQTLDAARRLRISVQQLTRLSDVDVPEDLIACRRMAEKFRSVFPLPKGNFLSVIVPVLNEQKLLPDTLKQFVGNTDIEVLVVDGGSTDETRHIARRAGATVIPCQPGRGRQMNAGAALARGDVLLFLHADTRLPAAAVEHIRRALDSRHAAGAFRLRIDAAGGLLRMVEFLANLRSRWLQMPYGDQAIFVQAKTFYEVQGYKNWPLMEDVDLCRRLKRVTRIIQVPKSVTTSARRWQRLGVLRTTFRNQLCLLAFLFGVSAEQIATWYQQAGELQSDPPPTIVR